MSRAFDAVNTCAVDTGLMTVFILHVRFHSCCDCASLTVDGYRYFHRNTGVYIYLQATPNCWKQLHLLGKALMRKPDSCGQRGA